MSLSEESLHIVNVQCVGLVVERKPQPTQTSGQEEIGVGVQTDQRKGGMTSTTGRPGIAYPYLVPASANPKAGWKKEGGTGHRRYATVPINISLKTNDKKAIPLTVGLGL